MLPCMVSVLHFKYRCAKIKKKIRRQKVIAGLVRAGRDSGHLFANF